MFEFDPEAHARALAAVQRWGFPTEFGPHAGEQLMKAMELADSELDIFYGDQRALLARVLSEGVADRKFLALAFGLMMQAMFVVVQDADKAGGA